MNHTDQPSNIGLARTTAHLLYTARYVWHFNLALCVIGLWFGRQSTLVYWQIFEVLLTVLILFFLVRIQFDARLLTDVAQGRLTLEHLDNALAQLNLRPTTAMLHSMRTRCLGCMRLFYVFCGLTVAHFGMLLVQFLIYRIGN